MITIIKYAKRWSTITMFIPDNFVVPTEVEFSIAEGLLRLQPLGRFLARIDYDVVVTNRDHLKGVFGELDNWWPSDDLSFYDNYDMLIWHEEQFIARESFAYAICLNKSYIGCTYIYGLKEVCDIVTDKDPKKIYVFMWTDKAMFRKGVDAKAFLKIKQWIENVWCFAKADYPGRITPLSSFGPKTAAWIITSGDKL